SGTSTLIFQTSTLAANLWNDTPAGNLLGKTISFRVVCTLTGTKNSKRIAARVGSGTQCTISFGASFSGLAIVEGMILFGPGTQEITMFGVCDGAAAQTQRQANTEAMTSDTDFT